MNDRNSIYVPLLKQLARVRSLWTRDGRVALASKESAIVDRRGCWALKAWRCSDGVIDRVTGIDLNGPGHQTRVFLWILGRNVDFFWDPFPEDFDRFIFGVSLLDTIAVAAK